MGFLGVVLIAAWFRWYWSSPPEDRGTDAAFLSVMTLCGALEVVNQFRQCVVVLPDEVRVVHLFYTRRIRRSDVESVIVGGQDVRAALQVRGLSVGRNLPFGPSPLLDELASELSVPIRQASAVEDGSPAGGAAGQRSSNDEFDVVWLAKASGLSLGYLVGSFAVLVGLLNIGSSLTVTVVGLLIGIPCLAAAVALTRSIRR